MSANDLTKRPTEANPRPSLLCFDMVFFCSDIPYFRIIFHFANKQFYIFKLWLGHLWLRQITGRVHWSINNNVLRGRSCICGTAVISWGTAVQIACNMNVQCRNVTSGMCAVSHLTSNISHRTYGAAAVLARLYHGGALGVIECR